MEQLSKFEISYSRPDATYRAGSLLEGRITIGLNTTMRMNAIKLRFKGKAKVKWSESTGSGQSQRTETHKASQKYFDQDTIIYAPQHGRNTTELGPGTHTFMFNFCLPRTTPSSYKDRIGKVKYVTMCRIERPWKTDLKIKLPFTVITPLDLNGHYCSRPVQGSNQKRLCCFCCKSGPISATVYLDRSGYVPGEAIAVKAEINNNSSRRIFKTCADLEKVTTYHATTKSTTNKKKIARITRPGFPAGGDAIWNGEELVIPPAVPSKLQFCTIIDVEYRLKLRVVPAGPARDLKVPVDITIGTIPLRSVGQPHPPRVASSTQGTDTSNQASQERVTHPPLPSGMPNQRPPKYLRRLGIQESDLRPPTDDLTYSRGYTFHNWAYLP